MRKKHNQEEVDFAAKIIIVGDSGVGKTNILYRFCNKEYKPSLVSTVGVDFRNKNIETGGKRIKLQIWDTAGQERFKNVNQTYFKGALAVILAYSITDLESFKSIQSWIQQINQNSTKDITQILVAAKCDLEYERKVPAAEGAKIAKKYGMEFFEVSSKEGTNIEELFAKLGEKVLKVLLKKAENSKDTDKTKNYGNRVSLDRKEDKIREGRCKC